MLETVDSVVIGGGFYGVEIALREAAARGPGRVVLLERGPRLLHEASYVNQARVHHGYHYPRSFLTGARSCQHYQRFVDDYSDCIDATFDAYYAIARRYSKVTAREFAHFCQRIGAPLEEASEEVRTLFDPQMVEAVFRVEEVAFNALLLSRRLRDRLHRAGVEVRTGTAATGLRMGDGSWILTASDGGPDVEIRATRVFNCTYAALNQLLHAAGLGEVPLKHELAELVLVDPPPELRHRAITVMCGPFFSITPFPAEGCHILSHVRYTPHAAWVTGDPPEGDGPMVGRCSRAAHMLADARRFLPCIADSQVQRSLWAIKTVLPRNEVDDGRPILVHRQAHAPGLVSVMGSKIDNVYDVLALLDAWETPDAPA